MDFRFSHRSLCPVDTSLPHVALEVTHSQTQTWGGRTDGGNECSTPAPPCPESKGPH